MGAVAALQEVAVVGGLPKTRSGKILRKTMREIADGGTPTVPGVDSNSVGPMMSGGASWMTGSPRSSARQ